MANLYEKQKTEKYSLYQMADPFLETFCFNKKPSKKYKIKISLSDPKDTAAKRIES